MANKFLGLDSINVLTSYIDQAVAKKTENSLMVTIQAYKYFKFGEDIDTPNGGGFNFNLSQIEMPGDCWSSLASVIKSFTDNGITIEEALSEGAIYVSSAVITGKTEVVWSTPMRISGQNGVSVKFAYAYDPDTEESERSPYPNGVDSNNREEWVWTKEAEGEWQGPVRWAKYSVDATNVVWRYCLSTDIEEGCPVNPTPWSLDLPLQAITAEYPYMWMSYKIIPAREIDKIEDEPNTPTGWTSPVLFGHYGKDGKDGHAPNYNITLYKYAEGYTRPNQPTLGNINEETNEYEFAKLEDFRANNPDWLDVPTTETPMTYSTRVVSVDNIVDLNANLIDGNTIKLTNDIETPTPIILTEGNVTIDLNGHNITAGVFMESNGEVLEGNTDSYVFWVKGGHLTIQGNGVVKAVDASYSMAVWSNGGDVTIKGGRYENGGQSCDLIYGSARMEGEQRIGGTITIYDGEFYATEIGEEAGTGNKRSALNTKNADEDICKIVVYGGYFHEFNPADNKSLVNSNDSFLAPNVTIVNNNGVYEVVSNIVKLWWQCTINIDGADLKVISIGNVERYTALDGTAKPGQFTKFVYKWFETQSLPNNFEFNIEEWNESPDQDSLSNLPESSLWMCTAIVDGIDASGNYVIGNWSNPIKITGPRGPIAYDYRIETRYNIGTSAKPKAEPTKEVWQTTPPNTTTTYPYVWAMNYITCYKMKYSDTPDADGEYPIVEDGMLSAKPIDTKGYFRVSGVDGEDGNKKNSLNVYEDKDIKVTSFSQDNLFVSASESDSNYSIELDQISFLDGYTGKFCNIGTGTMKLTTKKQVFVGSGKSVKEMTINPQETVELVCYNKDGEQQLLVIGKTL